MIPPFGVARYDPLKIYVNYEGLVRFATELYSESVETLQSRTEDLDNCNSKHRRSKQIVLPTRYLFLLCAWQDDAPHQLFCEQAVCSLQSERPFIYFL